MIRQFLTFTANGLRRAALQCAIASVLHCLWMSADCSGGPAVRGGVPANRIGVHVSRFRPAPDTLGYLAELGGSWVRVNLQLDGADQDSVTKEYIYERFMEAGLSVVLTISNQDSGNREMRWAGSGRQEHRGFPYRDKERYRRKLRAALAPALKYVARGQEVWVQCENEVGPQNVFWGGTIEQYLTQLETLYETVHAVKESLPVVASGIASPILDALVAGGHPRVVQGVTQFLSKGKYDAVDLHFYGCAKDIPAKVAWIRARMPPGKRWISTEDAGPDWWGCRQTPLKWTGPNDAFETSQTAEVGARLRACLDNGSSVCLWFALYDMGAMSGKPNDWDTHFGLVESRKSGRKKPAYEAFRNFVAAQSRR